jgi:hypothetical protein
MFSTIRHCSLGRKLWAVTSKSSPPYSRSARRHLVRDRYGRKVEDRSGQAHEGRERAYSGRTHDTVLSDMSLTAVLRRMGEGDITVHPFRSTFRDGCAEAAGNSFSREVGEHALAHSLLDKVEAA